MALRRPHFSCDSSPRASVHLLLLLEVPYSHRAWGLRLLVCRGASPSRGAVVGTNREQRNVSRLPISRWQRTHHPAPQPVQGAGSGVARPPREGSVLGQGSTWGGRPGPRGTERHREGPSCPPQLLRSLTFGPIARSRPGFRITFSVGFSLSDETVVEVPPCSTVTTAHALGEHGSAHSRSLKH